MLNKAISWQRNRPVLRGLTLFVATFLIGCATRPAYHGFDFRPLVDSPAIRVVDWQYGELRPPRWELERAEEEGVGLQGANVSAPMTVPNEIRVKWQVPPDTKVIERTIDISGKLPRSMDRKRILLIFRAGEPHVYLIAENNRPCDGATCGARVPSDVSPYGRSYAFSTVTQIYPTPTR